MLLCLLTARLKFAGTKILSPYLASMASPVLKTIRWYRLISVKQNQMAAK